MRSLISSILLSLCNLKYIPKQSKKQPQRTKEAAYLCPRCIIRTNLQPLRTSQTTSWLIKTHLSTHHFNKPRQRRQLTRENPPPRLASQPIPPPPSLLSKRGQLQISELLLSSPLHALSSTKTSERFFLSRPFLRRTLQGISRSSSSLLSKLVRKMHT